jgi:hypothetical protein
MARRDMPAFMSQHTGNFCLARSKPEQAAHHVDIATRQGKGVDLRRIEDRELPGQVRALGFMCELEADLSDVPLHLWVFVLAILSQDLGVLFLCKLHLLLLGHAEQ